MAQKLKFAKIKIKSGRKFSFADIGISNFHNFLFVAI